MAKRRMGQIPFVQDRCRSFEDGEGLTKHVARRRGNTQATQATENTAFFRARCLPER